MHCPHCGKTIKDASKACEYCGEKIEAGSSSPGNEKEKKSTSDSKSPPLKNEEKGKKEALSSRSRDGENRRGEKEVSEPPSPTPKSLTTWILRFVIGAFIVGGLYYFFSDHSPPPPPATPSEMSSNADNFYPSLRAGIQETGVAKKYFNDGQAIMKAEAPEMPASMPAETAPTTRFLKAAENYARAIERFKFAQQVIENVHLKTGDNREMCKKSFSQILDRYLGASEIFDENAKTLSQGEADKKIPTSSTDAKAKYEMADQLMAKFLMDGCNGDFFKAVASKDEGERRAALKAYRGVLLENFEPQKAALEKLFQATTPPENSQAESNEGK